MNQYQEKRTEPRIQYSVPVEISHVNEGYSFNAKSLNHCECGMCVESSFSFHTGDTINVRVKEFHPNGPCIGLCEGLRSMSLGEVKWCSEAPEDNATHYRVGIKFLPPVY